MLMARWTKPYDSSSDERVRWTKRQLPGCLALALALAVGIAAGPAGAQVCAYVTNFDSNTVSVIDTAQARVVDTIGVGNGPVGVALVPGGQAVYVANFLSDTVSVIDTRTHQVVRTVSVDAGPSGVAATPNGSKVYVTNHFSDSISVFSTATQAVQRTIVLPAAACDNAEDCGLNGVTVNPAGTRAYVAGARRTGGDFQVSLTVIDTATDGITPKLLDFGTIFQFGGSRPPGPYPSSVAVDPSGSSVYLTDSVKFLIRRFNAAGTVQTAQFDRFSPIDIATAPQGGQIYGSTLSCDVVGRTEFCFGAVAVISGSLDGVAATIRTTACEPFDSISCIDCPAAARCFTTGIATDPNGSSIYVLNLHTSDVSVINAATRRVVSTIAVGTSPLEIAIGTVPGGCALPTATRAATATRTATRTPTQPPTATRTASRSATASATRTASRTQTPSRTATSSQTPTPSRAFSPSSTPVPTRKASPSPTIPIFFLRCTGDCNADGAVSIEEIITGVNIGLGSLTLAACPSFDSDGDGAAAITELIEAVFTSLNGCLLIIPVPG